ncbi:5-dehydro-4-deoxy-D-glucuronate isomerase [Roseibium sp.]|uniref:5-dehydro-4-deoxy-D-glucuronate isomerase n=1 Tax=Roseibium sp. TaxID=1936156 RepID=UPI003BAD0C09
MLTVETRYAIDPDYAKTLDTDGIRKHFHADGLFVDDEIKMVYSHYDRLILGGVAPVNGKLVLDEVTETGTPSLLDRRELGVLNIGATGTVEVDGQTYEIARGDVLYVGMGAGPVSFSAPGRYYVLSAPAHRGHPTRLIRAEEARRVELGSAETANKRVILQFLHPEVAQSCQLMMGYTQFAPGSVWNTMPAHVHDRRMEAYLYFDLGADQRVFHFMGKPDETRHLVVANEEAILSPPWSIHCGAGTGAYTFCWAMAGDNMDFTDMDMVAIGDLR